MIKYRAIALSGEVHFAALELFYCRSSPIKRQVQGTTRNILAVSPLKHAHVKNIFIISNIVFYPMVFVSARATVSHKSETGNTYLATC